MKPYILHDNFLIEVLDKDFEEVSKTHFVDVLINSNWKKHIIKSEFISRRDERWKSYGNTGTYQIIHIEKDLFEINDKLLMYDYSDSGEWCYVYTVQDKEVSNNLFEYVITMDNKRIYVG
jgi:hypothetical protein